MRLEELLSSQARAAPRSVALTTAGGRHCSYGELDHLSDSIRDRLRAIGVGPGDRVGICASKRIETVAALFGVLKAGAAYVPVDPDAPAVRNATLLADCGVRGMLVDPERWTALDEALEGLAHTVHRADRVCGFELISTASPPPPDDGSLAYILYTSGSTGVPKGVCHTHASALAFVHWCSVEFEPTDVDRFCSLAPFHFDLSIFDIYVSLKHGAAVRLIEADESRHPKALAELIAAERLTVWYSTPTVLRALIEHGDLAAFDHSSLRLVCFAGEVFPTKHLRTLATLWPRAGLYNLYGPTETNVCAFHRVEAPRYQADDVVIPIGFACSGNQLRVVSDSDELVARGQEGELLVHGDSVMKGYWGAPDKNAGSFAILDGLRWYRTGDIVVEREDGALTFRGRRDRMIKRRGYRIELGEIETALSRHEHISQAAVVGLPDAAGDMRIVAFYTWTSAIAPSFVEMKRYCRRVLPGYMSPDFFKVMAAVPGTSTGKTDYLLLAAIAHGFLFDKRPA